MTLQLRDRLRGGLSSAFIPNAPERPAAFSLRLLGRHQIAALAATFVDFAAMVASVEAGGVSPVIAAAVGAAVGAAVNFTLAHRWVFQAEGSPVGAHVLRYAVVSGAGAAWNALGEHLLFGVLGVHYVSARVIVAVAVSLGWSFPMQRGWVFRHVREYG